MKPFLLACAIVCSATFAQAFDDEDRAGVEAAVADFVHAMNARNWEAVLPPDKMIAAIAELTGIEPDQMRELALKSIDDSIRQIEFESYRIETEQMKGGTSDAGADYAYMPAYMKFSLDGGPIQEIKSVVLAAELDEGWRLFRMDEPKQLLLFLRVYPQFEGLSLNP